MWCKNCNIETNEEKCPICGEETVEDYPTEYEGLADMVREVNDTDVDIEERLSYHVYVYSRDEETLQIVA